MSISLYFSCIIVCYICNIVSLVCLLDWITRALYSIVLKGAIQILYIIIIIIGVQIIIPVIELFISTFHIVYK